MKDPYCSIQPPQPSDYIAGAGQAADDGFQKFVEKFGELSEGGAKNIAAARVFGIFSAIYTVVSVVINV